MHDNQHNDQNYVTREEFIEFKESVNSQFQSVNEQLSQIKQSIEKLGGGNFNKERQRDTRTRNRMDVEREEREEREEGEEGEEDLELEENLDKEE